MLVRPHCHIESSQSTHHFHCYCCHDYSPSTTSSNPTPSTGLHTYSAMATGYHILQWWLQLLRVWDSWWLLLLWLQLWCISHPLVPKAASLFQIQQDFFFLSCCHLPPTQEPTAAPILHIRASMIAATVLVVVVDMPLLPQPQSFHTIVAVPL